MPKAKQNGCCARPDEDGLRVESIVSVDERGQMVLPKDIREKAGIRPGDKLAVVTKEQDGRVCCIYLFKSDELMEAVRSKLGPLTPEVLEVK